MHSPKGHSGARLSEYICKTTSEDNTEECKKLYHLSAAGLVPKFYVIDEYEYFIRKYPQMCLYDSAVLQRIHERLKKRVWDSPPLRNIAVADYIGNDGRCWIAAHELRFKLTPPDYVWDEAIVYTHGDPTASNVVDDLVSGELLFIDPKPHGRGIPNFASVDRGKLLQSFLGWEALRYAQIPPYAFPFRWGAAELYFNNVLLFKRAIYWCAIHMKRIQQRENPDSLIYTWANSMETQLFELLEKHK